MYHVSAQGVDEHMINVHYYYYCVPRCGKGDILPESTSNADSLTVSAQHASTSVPTLKIPNTGSHIPLFGHTKTLHTLVGMGSPALAAAVLYPGKATRTSHSGQ